METLEALILTITVLNLVSKGLSFYYTVIFTDPLLHKQFVVPFIDSSSRPEVFSFFTKFLVLGLWLY